MCICNSETIRYVGGLVLTSVQLAWARQDVKERELSDDVWCRSDDSYSPRRYWCSAYRYKSDGATEAVSSSQLRARDVIKVEAGQFIAGDGEVIEGVASGFSSTRPAPRIFHRWPGEWRNGQTCLGHAESRTNWRNMASQGPGRTSAARKLGGRHLRE